MGPTGYCPKPLLQMIEAFGRVIRDFRNLPQPIGSIQNYSELPGYGKGEEWEGRGSNRLGPFRPVEPVAQLQDLRG
jgi:hypothetical protein